MPPIPRSWRRSSRPATCSTPRPTTRPSPAGVLGRLKTPGPGALARLRDEPGRPAAAVADLDGDPDEDPVRLGDGDMDQGDAVQAQIAWQGCGAAFTELVGELTEEE